MRQRNAYSLRMQFTALVTLLIAPMTAAPPQDTDPPAGLARDTEAVNADSISAHRPRLIELLRAGIDTKSPNASRRDFKKRTTPFDGSYDWHSCVIAHWALCVEARTTEDTELEGWLMKRLTPDVLRAELESVSARKRKRRVTYPYDEVWLGLLLSEIARRDAIDMAPLLKQRQALEGRLLDTLEAADFPENFGVKKGDESERYCGFYRSSLFLYLALRWTDCVGDETTARLDVWRDQTLAPKRAEIRSIEETFGYDFLSLPALLALTDRVDRVEGDPEPMTYAPPELTGWPESVIIATVHVLGLELSRVWPCAVDASRGDAAARALYEARVRSLLERRDLWETDFPTCSHWIPQYLYIGEWLRAGRP